MELESLATNVFFNTLRGSHEDVWHSVARNGWLLCVPQQLLLLLLPPPPPLPLYHTNLLL